METVNKEELKQRRIKHAQILGKNKMRAEAVRQMKIAGFKKIDLIKFKLIFYELSCRPDKTCVVFKTAYFYFDIRRLTVCEKFIPHKFFERI